MSRLLILSNMAHYLRGDEIVGTGPPAIEIDHLATLFDEVRHVACLHDEPAPASALPYRASNVTLVPVPPAGGPSLLDKLGIVRRIHLYLQTMQKELDSLSSADAVHVRCPANLPLLALLLLSLRRRPRRRWIKYGGAWGAGDLRSRSAAFQRWWLLRGWAGGVVTVNGDWPDAPDHVRSFDNPCLTAEELRFARTVGQSKEMSSPLRALFVGRLEEMKGIRIVLECIAILRRHGVEVVLELAGGGDEAAGHLRWADAHGLSDSVTYHGPLPRPDLVPLYGRAHLLFLPSETEGWPKVVSESLAHGVVPLTSRVSCLPRALAEIGSGRALDRRDPEAFASAARFYVEHPDIWQAESRAGSAAASRFTYEAYLESVRRLIEEWDAP